MIAAISQTNEATLRFIFFAAILIAIGIWEIISPRRQLTVAKGLRWGNNLGIIFLDTLLLRMLFSTTAIGVAEAARISGWGLLNILALPAVPAILLGFLLLDLAIYFQHLMFHAVPLFWRLHMVHHADLDIDVTTGLRFHPIEMVLSLGIKIGIVAALGPPGAAVFVFEVALNGTSLFNHGNIWVPQAVDRWLRLFVVTPDMHRVHHSVIIRETNSNFGFNLPWWDKMFGTYRAQPVAEHERMAIGLSQFRKQEKLNLPRLLALPFSASPGKYAFDHIGQDPEVVRKRSER